MSGSVIIHGKYVPINFDNILKFAKNWGGGCHYKDDDDVLVRKQIWAEKRQATGKKIFTV
jgi:hypothetical protein